MKIFKIKNKQNHFLKKINAGFTLIEIIVTISLVGILAAISFISYGSWESSIASTVIKNDLANISSAMESARTFNDIYPTSIPTSFSASSNITLSGGSSDGGKTYCVTATSTKDSSINYYIDSFGGSQNIKPGVCGSVNLTATATSASTADITWSAITNATSYTLQRDVNELFSSPTDITQASTSAISTGLSSLTKYYYRVRARVANVDGGWSKTTNTTTLNYSAPSDPIIVLALEDGDLVATITPVTCASGTAQYGTRGWVNGSGVDMYSSWKTILISSPTIVHDGYKYEYQAQARCYIDATNISPVATGLISTYIEPITAPTTPVVAANNVTTTTTYSWNTSTCPANTNLSYQYRYTISPSGYDSGLVLNATSPIAFTTPTAGQTHTVAVQARCSNANAVSAWSAAGSASYTVAAAGVSAPATVTLTLTTNSIDISTIQMTGTVTPVTCTTGTAQYSFRSASVNVNAGAWTTYSAWSTTRTNSKFISNEVYTTHSLQAQARCYVDAANISAATASAIRYYTVTDPGGQVEM